MFTHAAVIAMAIVSAPAGSNDAVASGDGPSLTFERTIIDLGPVSDEAPLRQPFKFVYTGLRITKLQIEHCHFCPAPESDRPSYEPGQSGFVIVELDTMGKHGDIQTTADISIPGEPDSHVQLQLKASVRPRFMVRPDFLTLRNVLRTQGADATVVFIGRQPGFEIKSVKTASPWVEAELRPAREIDDLGDPCRGYDVNVRLKPGLPLGDFKAVVQAETNDPARPVMGTTIDVEVVGDLVTDHDHVTVGWLTPGQRYAASFILSSRSNRPLFYGSVRLDVRPDRGMGPVVLDVEPGDELGTLRIRAFGSAPLHPAQRVEADIVVTEEDAAGRIVDEITVPVRMGVHSNRILR